jgi:hypothetical protein
VEKRAKHHEILEASATESLQYNRKLPRRHIPFLRPNFRPEDRVFTMAQGAVKTKSKPVVQKKYVPTSPAFSHAPPKAILTIIQGKQGQNPAHA